MDMFDKMHKYMDARRPIVERFEEFQQVIRDISHSPNRRSTVPEKRFLVEYISHMEEFIDSGSILIDELMERRKIHILSYHRKKENRERKKMEAQGEEK